MDGMVIHIATRECPITQPHPAMECGVVAARRRCQEEGDAAMRRQHQDEQGQPRESDGTDHTPPPHKAAGQAEARSRRGEAQNARLRPLARPNDPTTAGAKLRC